MSLHSCARGRSVVHRKERQNLFRAVEATYQRLNGAIGRKLRYQSFKQGELLLSQGNFLDRQLVGGDGADRDLLSRQIPSEKKRGKIEGSDFFGDLVIVSPGIYRVLVSVA